MTINICLEPCGASPTEHLMGVGCFLICNTRQPGCLQGFGTLDLGD